MRPTRRSRKVKIWALREKPKRPTPKPGTSRERSGSARRNGARPDLLYSLLRDHFDNYSDYHFMQMCRIHSFGFRTNFFDDLRFAHLLHCGSWPEAIMGKMLTDWCRAVGLRCAWQVPVIGACSRSNMWIVDFCIETEFGNIIIEIDGIISKKLKRSKDYFRNRNQVRDAIMTNLGGFVIRLRRYNFVNNKELLDYMGRAFELIALFNSGVNTSFFSR